MPTSSRHSPYPAGGGGSVRSEQEAIARQFWEVGRLTLEWWLTPRLQGDRFHRRPGVSVVAVAAEDPAAARVRLSDGTELSVDRIVCATGYKADVGRVPYLAGVLDRIQIADGFPVLDDTLPDEPPRPVRAGFRGDAGLRPVLRLHEGLSGGGGTRHSRADAARGLIGAGFDRRGV